MDRHVPPRLRRVTYWTGNWNPGREAISNEIESLRATFGRRNPVVALAAGQRSRLDVPGRAIALNGRRWLAYRALAAVIEPLGEITHAFGSIDAWHPLRALGRRPLVFTAVISGKPLDPALYRHVSVFVAESEPLAEQLITAGIEKDRMRLIYPGVDLQRFTPAPFPPLKRFRLLFASTPSDPSEFEARGIPLLVALARLRPEIDVVIAWRQWGHQRRIRAALAALNPPSNVLAQWGDIDDMPGMYNGVHATIVCPAEGHGKSCPNSVVEGLACGRPALLTGTSDIAALVRRHSAGEVVDRSAEALAAGVERLQANLFQDADCAVGLVRELFTLDRFNQEYGDLYGAASRRR